MAKNGKDTKPTLHIYRGTHFVRNGKGSNFHKIVWCEVGLQLADIATKNVKEYELNNKLGYAMVRLDNLQTTFQ